MRGRLKELTLNRDGTQNVTVTVSADWREEYDRLQDTEVDVTIRKATRKRSLDANAFCWALCKDLGDAMHLTKEEIYRRAIREVGEYEPLPIKAEAVETFSRRWAEHGTGWFVDVIDDSKLPGYKLIFAYYGSSTYSTETMSRLIDYLVQDAQAIGLAIPLGKAEQERLLTLWRA